MPRIKPLGVNPKDMEVKKLIACYLIERNMSNADLIRITKIPASTYYLAMKKPEDMRVGMLRQIFDALKIPDERRCGIL